ncbi:MAG: hypothetical protein IKO98_09020 [Bacteroidales bacterium]|nr:hypothetical protein [Bacteroidales bacterium]
MIEKHVVLRDIVWFDIATISEFIIKVSSPEHAKRYTQQLLDELATLSYLASVRPESCWLLPKRYHPHAKTYHIMKKRLTVIFHIVGDCVVADKILPSTLITY